jgi:transposase-like protein
MKKSRYVCHNCHKPFLYMRPKAAGVPATTDCPTCRKPTATRRINRKD